MELRVFTEPQQGATYEQLLSVAREAERLGYGAFFRSDHYLPMGGADGLPGPTDAWITLAGLARETTTIRLGTLVSAATFRLPGPLAISVAQVDQMSGGRVELGLGAAWFEAEHDAYGIEFPGVGERFDLLEEQLEIITGLWDTPLGEKYSFHGKHYRLTDSPALPKPVARPPIIVGGGGPTRTPALAVRFAAEFNLAFRSLEETRAQFTRVRDVCDRTGRTEPLVYSVAHMLCCGGNEAEIARRAVAFDRHPAELRANGIAGTPAEVVDRLGRFAELGVTRVYLQVLDLDDLDHLALVAAEVMGRI